MSDSDFRDNRDDWLPKVFSFLISPVDEIVQVSFNPPLENVTLLIFLSKLEVRAEKKNFVRPMFKVLHISLELNGPYPRQGEPFHRGKGSFRHHWDDSSFEVWFDGLHGLFPTSYTSFILRVHFKVTCFLSRSVFLKWPANGWDSTVILGSFHHPLFLRGGSKLTEVSRNKSVSKSHHDGIACFPCPAFHIFLVFCGPSSNKTEISGNRRYQRSTSKKDLFHIQKDEIHILKEPSKQQHQGGNSLPVTYF